MKKKRVFYLIYELLSLIWGLKSLVHKLLTKLDHNNKQHFRNKLVQQIVRKKIVQQTKFSQKK